MRTLLTRLAALFRRGSAEREFDEEIRFHLEGLAEEYRAKGLSERAAMEAARRDFGGVEQIREVHRERRGIPAIENTLGDVRYGLRGLARSPAFALAAVVSLALGIGANTAIFSLVNTLMLRLLPVREPQQLVSLYRQGGWGEGYTSYPLYLELKRRTDLFEGLLARSSAWRVRYSLGGQRGEPAFLYREYVSQNYFEVLGVGPLLGDVFAGADGARNSRPVAVLSHAFWQSRFGGDPAAIGRQMVIDEQAVTVIGVAQKRFDGVQVETRTDVWMPVTMSRSKYENAGMQWLWLLGRPAQGVGRGRLQAAVSVLVKGFLDHEYGSKPDTPWKRKSMEQRLEVRSGGVGVSLLRERFEEPLIVLLLVVGLVLLVACSNVANLLLARAAARRREIALRLSLGASRIRLVRQWMTETSLLGAAGMAGGALLGVWGSRLLLQFIPRDETSLPLNVQPDLNVLGFTVAVSAAALLLFGLVPALRASDLQPNDALKEGGAGGAGSRRNRLRKALVVAQVALSAVLISGAFLFSRSLLEMRSTDPGFRNFDVVSFHLDAPRSHTPQQLDQLRDRLLRRALELPGVVSASSGFPGPYQGGIWSGDVQVPGSRKGSGMVYVEMQSAGPRYFETIGSMPLRGEDFTEANVLPGRKVAIVNEAFVREYLPDSDPLQRELSDDDAGAGGTIQIIGVVRDMRHRGLRERVMPTLYLPVSQAKNSSDPVLLVRSRLGSAALSAALRAEVKKLDPAVAAAGLKTVRESVDDSMYVERLVAAVSGLFGVLALILAGVGLYGVMTYLVVQRTREIGIRVALGASPGRVVWSVARESLVLMGCGTALGLPLAVAGSRLAESLLYGVRPGDPATFVWSGCALLAVGVAASLMPARRAASIPPRQSIVE
ncbi:MAG: ABC transporter permease [Acidobacteria bacterium]|nr:ABC transporter permease [Acidobacteriota bacterium]